MKQSTRMTKTELRKNVGLVSEELVKSEAVPFLEGTGTRIKLSVRSSLTFLQVKDSTMPSVGEDICR
jgi:hypothetical protein